MKAMAVLDLGAVSTRLDVVCFALGARDVTAVDLWLSAVQVGCMCLSGHAEVLKNAVLYSDASWFCTRQQSLLRGINVDGAQAQIATLLVHTSAVVAVYLNTMGFEIFDHRAVNFDDECRFALGLGRLNTACPFPRTHTVRRNHYEIGVSVQTYLNQRTVNNRSGRVARCGRRFAIEQHAPCGR